ncbi:hypothetical protein LY90DRAFT_260349 [Neocallimastix californiae]|uniref:Uncharacterized protein n=1 Tax=Neocallimastix californiae TaxID=1754190 RepID=A0A1Y2DAC8_9FUNG|nr:hypothetical protein LY90DRAFT_260349 [Neocallimastix californiae]|eukprot:ORY56222.1 hypothetical protein LY90DRAFT_260349 [Neocallimastix californiae]
MLALNPMERITAMSGLKFLLFHRIKKEKKGKLLLRACFHQKKCQSSNLKKVSPQKNIIMGKESHKIRDRSTFLPKEEESFFNSSLSYINKNSKEKKDLMSPSPKEKMSFFESSKSSLNVCNNNNNNSNSNNMVTKEKKITTNDNSESILKRKKGERKKY